MIFDPFVSIVSPYIEAGATDHIVDENGYSSDAVSTDALRDVVDAGGGKFSPSDAFDSSGLSDFQKGLLDVYNNILGYIQSPEMSVENQWTRNEQSAENALNRALRYNREKYLSEVEGLKAAGLNPILAVQNGLSSGGTVAPMATSSAAEGTRLVDFISALSGLLNGVSSLFSAVNPVKSAVDAVAKTVTKSSIFLPNSTSYSGVNYRK